MQFAVVDQSGIILGIVGLGRIGTAMANRAKCLGFDVVFFDPYKQDGYDKALGIRRASSIDDLLAQSYVVSLHCPLNDDTYGLINAGTLARMQRGSFLVNTARGSVIDTSALLDAIESGHLAGAALDVLPVEPPEDDDSLILAWRDLTHAAHSRIIINPHAAFYSEQGLLDMRTKGAQACRRALLEQAIPNVVN
jgi:C-terminal binding protein